MIRLEKQSQSVIDNLVAIEELGGAQAVLARSELNGVYADLPAFNENVESLAPDIANKFGMSTAELLGVRVQKKDEPMGGILSPFLEHVRSMFAVEDESKWGFRHRSLTIDVVGFALCPRAYYDDAKQRETYQGVAADALGSLVDAGVLKVEERSGVEWYSLDTGPCGGRAGAVREKAKEKGWALWIWILSRLIRSRARRS